MDKKEKRPLSPHVQNNGKQKRLVSPHGKKTDTKLNGQKKQIKEK